MFRASILAGLLILAVPAAGQERITAAWDSVLTGAAVTHAPPEANPTRDFLKHLYFESRTEYWRYNTHFTGLPTATGLINAPFTGEFNPNGIPYPLAFEPQANRVYAFIDFGTRGWLSERLNTHFSYRYAQDLQPVNTAAPAANLIETFPGNRRIDLTQANIEIQDKPAATVLSLGRQYVFGAEIAALDGVSLSVRRKRAALTVFGGRRFSNFSDPIQRAIGGANLVVRLANSASVEYDGLWYVRGTNRVALHKRFADKWLVSSYFRSYGSAPVDFSASTLYIPANGRSTLRLGFFQKLSNRDYYYDYTYFAANRDPRVLLSRLNLGPISPYSQLTASYERAFTGRLEAGSSVWVRRLNDAAAQGAFDTSFVDFRAHAQLAAWRGTTTQVEYHQRNSDRLPPAPGAAFDDIQRSGETRIEDVTAEARRNFFESRLQLSGGAYYRLVRLQDNLHTPIGAYQSGWLAGAAVRLDSRTRLYGEYNLDNDFFLYRPSIANSRILRLGVRWKY